MFACFRVLCDLKRFFFDFVLNANCFFSLISENRALEAGILDEWEYTSHGLCVDNSN